MRQPSRRRGVVQDVEQLGEDFAVSPRSGVRESQQAVVSCPRPELLRNRLPSALPCSLLSPASSLPFNCSLSLQLESFLINVAHLPILRLCVS